MLSLTSDYITDEGTPEAFLGPMADAGFTHVHWCHEWNTDYLYTAADVRLAKEWLQAHGLQLVDLHASAGIEKDWVSSDEDARQAGVELVQNRMRMTARLGGEVIVLHLRPQPAAMAAREAYWSQVRKSLDALAAVSADLWVRIALENLSDDNYATLEQVFEDYDADFVGLCYDSGHGQIAAGGLDFLERVKDRLIALHLHDNDGKSDLHRLPLNGYVDWRRLMPLIAASPYNGPITLEATIANSGFTEPGSFLRQAALKATAVAGMLRLQRERLAAGQAQGSAADEAA